MLCRQLSSDNESRTKVHGHQTLGRKASLSTLEATADGVCVHMELPEWRPGRLPAPPSARGAARDTGNTAADLRAAVALNSSLHRASSDTLYV